MRSHDEGGDQAGAVGAAAPKGAWKDLFQHRAKAWRDAPRRKARPASGRVLAREGDGVSVAEVVRRLGAEARRALDDRVAGINELLGSEFEGLDMSKRLVLPEDMLETEGKGQIFVMPLSELREKNAGKEE